MLYKNKNYAWKTLPDFQDGDIVDGGNYSQNTVTEISADLEFVNRPNMFNINLTGNNNGKCLNVKKDLCYHLNCLFDDSGDLLSNPKNLPVEIENCRHVDSLKIINIETDGGIVQGYSEAREDIIL